MNLGTAPPRRVRRGIPCGYVPERISLDVPLEELAAT